MNTALIRRRVADVRRAMAITEDLVKNTSVETREDAHGRIRARTVTTWDVVRSGGELLSTWDTKRDAMAALKREQTAAASTRDPQHLIGRWALPSGAAFKVLWLDEPNGRALCSSGGRRWYGMIADLHALLDRNQLRYLGRG